MEIAKALILAGNGSQDCAWPIAPSTRHLFPVANQPILFHNLEALRAAGILEATILADPGMGAAIERAVGDGRDWELSLHHATWNSAGGLPAALATAREFLADEPVFVEHGDALLRERMQGHISRFARERLDALALRLERRPDVPVARQLTPGYLLSARAVSILLAAREEPGSPIAHLRAGGVRVRVQRVDGCMPCHGDIETLLESNRCMLEGLAASVGPDSLEDSTVHGAVSIHPTARIRRSLLRGPAIVGAGATITDAYIGPYTSIGVGVTVEAAEIEHSIICPDAELRFIGNRLESSLIGRGARIVRGFDLPAAIRVSLGDGAAVILR
jgi:glucose-1-phosphate thymidylyltransferase